MFDIVYANLYIYFDFAYKICSSPSLSGKVVDNMFLMKPIK